MKRATIAGSGLVGSLWAIYLAHEGYQVNVYERRPDPRKGQFSAGKSINLATSYRGWKALDAVGAGDAIRKIATPMYGRTLHQENGSTAYQPYGNNNQAIYSVSRAAINQQLMDLAEKTGKVNLHFNEECVDADTANAQLWHKNAVSGRVGRADADILFATDGAFSAVRYRAMQKLDRFSYSQNYIADGYREILLPANTDGSYKMKADTLHIWPRGRFMLIALPNADGSFTCTLFMPFDGHTYCFNNLNSVEKVKQFFESTFPDFYALMPEVGEHWNRHPLSSLAIVRCYPWFSGRTILMGDAAHATVPFFGQGMNCGFEDCTVLHSLMKTHGDDWDLIGQKYQELRKPNGDAVQDLSLQNYLVMRDKVNDPDFQLLQRVERFMAKLYPENYFPLYSMVSFTDIEYQVALNKGNAQEEKIKALIKTHNITSATSDNDLEMLIYQQLGPLLVNA